LNTEHENIDDLIGKVLSHEATAMEQLTLNEWLRSDPANHKYFDDLKSIFESASTRLADFDFDTDAAWNKVSGRISNQGSPRRIIQFNSKKSSTFNWKVAAVITTLIGTATTLFLLFNNLKQEFVFESQDQILKQELADGSYAVLNRNTSLTFEVDKNNKERHAELSGEAFFEVIHNVQSEFVIESNGVFIRDIGTAFNVKALAGSDSVEVFVKEGEVEFYSNSNEGLHLTEGQSALYIRTQDTFVKNESPENLSPDAFFSKKFKFRNATLRQVVNSLNDAFKRKFIIADEVLSTCRITVSFDEEDPELIAQIISETLGLDLNIMGDRIIFSGIGCE